MNNFSNIKYILSDFRQTICIFTLCFFMFYIYIKSKFSGEFKKVVDKVFFGRQDRKISKEVRCLSMKDNIKRR